MARTTSISIYRGEDITLDFTVYTTDTGSTPEDITGWTTVFTVARARNSPSKLITKTCSIVSAVAGTLRTPIDDVDTDEISPGSTYFWDLWRTNAGYERVLGSGAFIILGNARIPPEG